MSRFLVAILMLVLTLPGCGRERARDATISTERFVAVNVALRQIERTAESADSLRAAVLEERGLTEEDLRRFVLARADRPEELAAVWGAIHERLLAQREFEAPQLDPETDNGGLREEPAGMRPGPLRVDMEPAAVDPDTSASVAPPRARRPAAARRPSADVQ